MFLQNIFVMLESFYKTKLHILHTKRNNRYQRLSFLFSSNQTNDTVVLNTVCLFPILNGQMFCKASQTSKFIMYSQS